MSFEGMLMNVDAWLRLKFENKPKKGLIFEKNQLFWWKMAKYWNLRPDFEMTVA